MSDDFEQPTGSPADQPAGSTPPQQQGAWEPDPDTVRAREGVFQTAYREITLSAVLVGLVVGVVMNAAITYSGLKIGFTIGGSAIAAVLGFAVLKGVLRKGSIIETNIVQTIASAVGNSNAGVIFTLPALLMMGVEFNVWLMICACMAGGVLGVAFIVPARKQMIDLERLKFPSATAVAAILQAPGAGPAKALVLMMGVIVSALVYLPTQLPLLESRIEIEELGEFEYLASAAEQAKIRAEDPLFARRHLFTLPEDEFEQLGAPDPETGERPESWFTRYKLDDVRRTRMIDEWMQTESVPDAWVERGNEQITRLADTNRAKQLAAELGVPWETSEEALEAGGKDKLAILAARLAKGEAEWSELRSVNFWASTPLSGYAAWARDADLRGMLARESEERDVGPDWAPDDEINEEVVLDTLLLQDKPDGDIVETDATAAATDVDRDINEIRDGHDRIVTPAQMVDLGALLGVPVAFGLLFAITPLSFGAGFLTGRPGLVVLGGGLLAFVFIAPLAHSIYEWIPPGTPPSDVAEVGRGLITRPLGIGMLMGGAFLGVIAALPAMKAAFGGLLAAKGGASHGGGRDELSLAFLGFAVFASFGVLFAAAHFSHSPDEGGLLAAVNPWVRHAIVAAIGTGWIWFAGIIIAQCTGMTDWSPISGLALLTVLVIMVLTNEVVAAVMVGAALCVAISEAADMMGDLKTGYLVGAQPRRQQFMEILAVSIGPAVAILVTIALHNVFVLGGDDFPAPQGQALEAAIRGIQGEGLPYMLYGTGILLGVLLGLGSFAGLGVLVGLSMYLPVVYIYTYGLGCVVNLITEKIKGREWTSEWCTPFFGGVIIGESVLGLIFAALVVYQTG